MTKKELIAAAFAHVYTDAEALIKDAAKEHCLANMGQDPEDFCPSGSFAEKHPGQIISACYSNFYQQSESDEMAEGIDDERKGWLKDSRRDVALVQKKGLPLTLANVRDAFEKKGVFAKKTKK